MFKRILMYGVLSAAMLFGAIQLVPQDRSRPPIVAEPAWNSAATRELAVRACFDCHSSETRWPWYSTVAPASWLIMQDVTGARDAFSFSNWQPGVVSAERAARVAAERRMPPARYLMLHPEARLTDAELEQLTQGLLASLK